MKDLQTNQDFRFNEVLFEGRNKQYGAYVLRNESDRILTKALFVGVSLLAAISLTPMLISAFKTTDVVAPPEGVIIDMIDPVDPYVEVAPPVQVIPQTTAPDVKTYDDRLPEPKRDAVEPKEVDKTGAIASTQNHDGEIVDKPTYIPVNPNIGPGTIAPPKVIPPTVPQDPDNSVKNPGELSVAANFESGIESFRTKVMNKFDGSGFASDDVMKTTVTFIVEKDGTISGIKADGKDSDFNNEALRTIKSIKGKWIPGKNKSGEAVRSYFKFPISMKFDN
jgi:protein TonB